MFMIFSLFRLVLNSVWYVSKSYLQHLLVFDIRNGTRSRGSNLSAIETKEMRFFVVHMIM